MLFNDYFNLREITESDLEIILKWRNSDRIRMNMFNDHIITFEEHLNWFKNVMQNHDNKHMVFEYKGSPNGIINVTRIDKRNSICHWGFYLGNDCAPAGSGLVMGYLGLEYIFEKLDFRKLCSEVFTFNIVSIKYHKKLGFVDEGVFKEHVLKNDKYEDILCMAHFRDNWLNIKNDLIKQFWR